MKILPIVLFLSISMTTPAFAGDTASRPVMEELYAKMQTARDNHDVKAVKELLDPKFTAVNVTGETMNYDATLKNVAENKRDPSKTGKTTVTNISQNGTVATVSHHYEETQNKTLPNGKKMTATVVSNSTDTWVNDPHQNWRLQRSIVEDVDFTMNGKKMMHQTRQNEVHQTQ
jgi:hypothetical protein